MVALVLSLGITSAFAADPTSGKITIKNSEATTEYDFYRLFDLAIHDLNEDESYTAVDSYIYSLNSKWHDVFTTGALKEYLVDTNSGNLNSINVDGAIKYINVTSSNVNEFTNAAMAVALGENGPAYDMNVTGTGEDLEVTANTLGYYLMIPVDASIKTALSTGTVASLTSTVPDVDVNVKAIKPVIQKTDEEITVDVGQTVHYTLTGTVPNTAGYETYVYKIADTMTSGLTFKKNVVVTIDGIADPITDACTIDYTTDTQGFTCTIPVKNYQNYIGKTITLTYTAVVNDNAVSSSQEKNSAQLIYGHNPSDLIENTPVEEEVYTAKIIVNKYTGDNPTAANAKLEGAKFALMNAEGKFYKYTAATQSEDAKVEWVTVSNGPAANETDAITDEMVNIIKAADITTYITDENGAAEFKGLADGTYYLVEFEAPTGYNRLQKATKVVVAGTDADTATGKIENKADTTGTFDVAHDTTADIQNNSGAVLPSTGGIGTTIFYVVGGVLVLAAIILLVTKKRMSE